MTFFRAFLICSLLVGVPTLANADTSNDVISGLRQKLIEACNGRSEGVACTHVGAVEAKCYKKDGRLMCLALRGCKQNYYLLRSELGKYNQDDNRSICVHKDACGYGYELEHQRFVSRMFGEDRHLDATTGKCILISDPCNDDALAKMNAAEGRSFNKGGELVCMPTKCVNGYRLETKSGNSICVECESCNAGTGAECKAQGSDGKVCEYETSCLDGYDSPINIGKYNPSCSPSKYNITYDLGGGTGCDNLPREYTFGTGATINCTPTRQGMKFAGWCDNATGDNCATPRTISTTDRGDKKFYASWTNCTQEQLSALGATRGKIGDDGSTCVATACSSRTAFINDKGKCQECGPCVNDSSVSCTVSVQDNLCKYKTDCNDGYENIQNVGQSNASCSKRNEVVEPKPEEPAQKTECDDNDKARFPYADMFSFDDGDCQPTHCVDGYMLKNKQCVPDGISAAQDAYKTAKENETSFENRMLGATTMAATGLGGMQLAQGLAEQSADRAAEQGMAAYLVKFQCKLGDGGGKSYHGGEKAIETPGANQLTDLYQTYNQLANSLKVRKTALGMKPGIESEVILDKSETGLYNNASTGIQNGTYASLYRASMGNENDINKLNEQREQSAQYVKGGAIGAGGGTAVGVVGNSAINGKLGDAVKSIINR